MKGVMAVLVVLLAAVGVARAQDHIALDEIVGSWQADDEIQYVELRMLAAIVPLAFGVGSGVVPPAPCDSCTR